ncbi:MAG: PhzF family phenazine biosynthesis protein [Acidimicrobiia bacterium]|nr:PhzF family phenazine biosynthesis protein [Acidimicrobiia bacterium]
MRRCQVLSVFTREGAGGNPLGVVTDPTGLDAAAMQAIAADLGFSETVFLDRQAEGAPRARIFTPAAEIPFAGHPLVGAGWWLGVGEGAGVRRLVCGIGEIPFRVEERRVFIEVSLTREVSAVAAASGVGGLPDGRRAWEVRLPLRYRLYEVERPDAVAGAAPDLGALAGAPWEGTLLFCRRRAAVRARFFAPALGVPEDPATGSAAVALAAALSFSGERDGAVTVDQGDEVGAPSRLEVVWGGGMVAVGGTVRHDGVKVLAI